MPDLLSSSDVPLGATGSTTQTLLPDWYTNYAEQILSNQNAVSAQPYTPYQGPRVAGFTPAQQAAFGQVQNAATSYQPTLDQAKTAAGSTLNMSALGAAQPTLSTGLGYLQQSAAPTGITMASPFLTQAGQSSVSDIGSYMNPYMSNVTDQIATLANRNLQENLLPQISDQFVGAGGYGGSRQAEAIGRALRDTQLGISQQQGSALASGYQGALQAAAADQARQAQLAGTAGQLGLGEQGALATAGQGSAYVGGQLGALTSADINARLGASGQLGALAQQQQQQQLTGANALQQVGALQQQNQQQNLDTAYQDFLRQQGWDQSQIDAMSKTLQGVAPAVPKSVLQTGYEPVPSAATNQTPSTAQTIANLAGAWLLGGR